MCEGVAEYSCCKWGARRSGKWLVYRELCATDLLGVFDSKVCRPSSGPFLCPGHSNPQTLKVCPHLGSKFVWGVSRCRLRVLSRYGKFPKIYGGGEH